MSGSRLRFRFQGLLAVALWTGVAVACSSETKPNELGLRVEFACASDRAETELLRLRVIAGDCDAGGEPVYEATLARGEQAPAADGIAPGSYGIEATALKQEDVVAYTCIEARLPRRDALELELRSASCTPEPEDAGGSMDAAADAGKPELDGDFTPDDADTDGTFVECPTECTDSDPCTEDLCMNGVCTHPAFTGVLECDGIPCTEGDMCVEGTCRPGTPNDAACADDGNPCTAETCVVSAGCNRSNAEANGRACNDNIGCTSADTCQDGICIGVDTCDSGEVCSAAQRICLSCTNAQDCDDSDPCTTDACTTGECRHTNNTAACNDGNVCTNNDVCSAGRCAGVSICPSDATCAGSTCSCNDGSETLCNSSCVDLQTTVSHCGLCGRACGSGQSCQNGACKPGAATTCTAFRNGGHDYLVCTDALGWQAARDRCRSFGLVLVTIESQAENDFVRARLGGAPRWLGANDRGSTGNNCRRSEEEGSWYWTTASGAGSNDNGILFCRATTSGSVSCIPESGRFQNWHVNEPNNGCTGCITGCGEGQDCGSMDPDGGWDDDRCDVLIGYVCETP